VVEVRPETPSAVTLALDVAGWPGHIAGQHVDVRLTAENGYAATRSYSIASGPSSSAGPLEITVQKVNGGEVSGYLAGIARPGDMMEVRGPIGGYFVWPPRDGDTKSPVLLVAGGSGIVPLMSMVRSRAVLAGRTPVRLIYSVRAPREVIYAEELRRRVRDDHGLDVAFAFTRAAPEGWRGRVGRISARTLASDGWPADLGPQVYVCGPTGFVEAVADLLVEAGHEPRRVRTERFGPTGG
jgi:ferredoxin-NADP reductase